MIIWPALMLLCIACIPAGVMLLYFAYDQPDRVTCGKCRYDMRGSPSRCCPECGHLNPPIEDAALRMRHPLLFALGLVLFGIPVLLIAGVVVIVACGVFFLD